MTSREARVSLQFDRRADRRDLTSMISPRLQLSQLSDGVEEPYHQLDKLRRRYFECPALSSGHQLLDRRRLLDLVPVSGRVANGSVRDSRIGYGDIGEQLVEDVGVGGIGASCAASRPAWPRRA